MYATKYIHLSEKEKNILRDITRKGKSSAQVIKRAWILLKSDAGWEYDCISEFVALSERTVNRRIERFIKDGINEALYDKSRPGQPKKLNNEAEAFLVATACSDPPEGRSRWTLELLQEKLIEEDKVDTISTVAIWNHLKNRDIKPWLEKNVVHS